MRFDLRQGHMLMGVAESMGCPGRDDRRRSLP